MEQIKKGGNFQKVSKSYTIRFSKGGILQYARFVFNEDNNLISNHFSASWCKVDELPKILMTDTIEIILDKIKEFSYHNNAEIYKIDGQPLFFYNYKNKESIKENIGKGEIIITELANSFFIENILPIMVEHEVKIGHSYIGMPVLIIMKSDGWDNLDLRSDTHSLIDYICFKFLKNVLGQDLSYSDEGEQGYVRSGGGFSQLYAFTNSPVIDAFIVKDL